MFMTTAIVSPADTLIVGLSYRVTYRDHRGGTVSGRLLTFLGRRDSEASRAYYPGEPGPVAMLDWTEAQQGITGSYGELTRLAFRASDLTAAGRA
jgi:hypothetical protein